LTEAVAISKRAAYDSYRLPGEGWIGEVPSHWEVERVKRLAQLASGHTPSRSEDSYWLNCSIPWVTLADVGPLRAERIETIETTSECVSEVGIANSAARLLPTGTVVLSRTASVGFAGVISRPMATSQDFFNWICGKRILPRFLLYCFRAMREEFGRITDGSTHQTIYWPDAERLTVPLPPVQEQEGIVAFLDAERGRILRLLDGKERLLRLLAERAESLVTGMILAEDHQPTSDDVAFSWLPPLKDGWRIVPLKHLAPFISRGTSPDYVKADGTPVLGQSCIYWDGLTLENTRLHEETHVAGLKGLLRRGDVLINSTGTGTLGRAQVFDEEGTFLADGHITIVRPKSDEVRPAYLAYLFRTGGYKAFVEQVLTVGSTDQIELSRDKLASAPILVPPLEVQDQIVARLDSELRPSLVVQEKTRRHLELLREYRQRLTFAAVTGQIRLVE
jgi:restriction endonuclease S subunit